MKPRHLPPTFLATVAPQLVGRAAAGSQRRRLPLSAVLMFLLLATMPAARATAQSADRDANLDSQRARADAAASTDRGSVISRNAFLDQAAAEDKTAPEYTLSVVAPGLYNSNAEAAPSNGTQTLEGNPEVRLAWSRSISVTESRPEKKNLTLSALVDASSDRFVRSKNADGDSAYAELRAQYKTDLDYDTAISPFLSYSPTLGFDPTFSKNTSTSHSLSLGFDKLYNYTRDKDTRKWLPVHAQDTSNSPLSVGFTATVTRRIWDSPPSLYIISAAPSLTYNGRDPNASRPKAQWITSLQLNISYRIYDRLADISRRDWLVNPVLTVEFLPALQWFQGEHLTEQQGDDRRKSLGEPKIDFQLVFTGLDSNQTAVQFHQWGIGPALKVAWSF